MMLTIEDVAKNAVGLAERLMEHKGECMTVDDILAVTVLAAMVLREHVGASESYADQLALDGAHLIVACEAAAETDFVWVSENPGGEQ